MLGPKVKLWRSEPYRRYVASHDCFGCGISDYSQCAHANEGKGLALKSGDDRTFPLCGQRPGHQGCHAIHDLRLDGLTRDEQRRIERAYVTRMRSKAREDGWKLPPLIATPTDAAGNAVSARPDGDPRMGARSAVCEEPSVIDGAEA